MVTKLKSNNIFKTVDSLYHSTIYIDNISINQTEPDSNKHYAYEVHVNGFWEVRVFINDTVYGRMICDKAFNDSCPTLESVLEDIITKTRQKKIENILKNA